MKPLWKLNVKPIRAWGALVDGELWPCFIHQDRKLLKADMDALGIIGRIVRVEVSMACYTNRPRRR